MSLLLKLLFATALAVVLVPAVAAPQIQAVVTNKGVRLDALSGHSQLRTITVQYSFLRDGERKSDTLECAGVLTSLRPGPLCARNLRRASEISSGVSGQRVLPLTRIPNHP